MLKVILSEKGQISIPAAVRREYGLKKGDKLLLEEIDGAIVLRPLTGHPLLSLKGKYKTDAGEKLTESLLRERKAERERDTV
ncbi:MAG: AbrB/MazE/SpoVT family DNA-binding domain-containing protein [Dethiobacter sp.]|jgi:AbrB family looped-hinge helix DNA binding protein|nr:AbrB/MazE/SpoVT family DNA-binding domain-containing protein [Dethiobacter sp.]